VRAARLRESVATLPPAYFALVMATGIVGVAVHLHEWAWPARALSTLNVVAYTILWVLLVLRIALFPSRVRDDFADFHRAPGFFTIVAATAVVGTELVLIHDQPLAALLAWLLALPLWFFITYGVFAGFTTAERKPTLGEGIDGGWLTAVVASQSIAVLGTLVSPSLTAWKIPVLFVSLAAWLQGGMLYIWLIALIFYRYTFFAFVPHDLTPPYWINMGAMAISTLSGALLIEHSGSAPFLAELVPFLKGFTMLFWATATWWIPMLAILGYWRHVQRRFALRYDPAYWGAVFPLGMYTVCTIHVARVMDVPFLLWIPRAFVAVAVAAWTLTAIGLARTIWKGIRGGPEGPPLRRV
jgi:tellurite resistance protein TehA-like permease